MYASKLCIGNLDLTRVLLNYGTSPGVADKDMEEGNTPLHWAIVGGVTSPYALSPLIRVSWYSNRLPCVPLVYRSPCLWFFLLVVPRGGWLTLCCPAADAPSPRLSIYREKSSCRLTRRRLHRRRELKREQEGVFFPVSAVAKIHFSWRGCFALLATGSGNCGVRRVDPPHVWSAGTALDYCLRFGLQTRSTSASSPPLSRVVRRSNEARPIRINWVNPFRNSKLL